MDFIEISRIRLRSHLFDKELIEKGKWPEYWKNQFELWNEETRTDSQKEIALDIMKNIIVKFLGDDCVPRGRVKIDRLGHMLDKLEQLLISTKTLDNKYYRDHLNHSIRVVLLSKLIANCEPFLHDENGINKQILSCVFHDISYPLSQMHKIINATIKSIKRGYNIADKISENFKTELNVDSEIMDIIFKDKIELIKQNLDKYDHGLFSALEFITYLKKDKEIYEKYSGLIQDIAYHTPNYDFQIDIKKMKNLAILILSDEIQDWGRPNNYNQIPISKIDPFEISNNKIYCNFVIDNSMNYSLLRQIYGKIDNLNRLKFNTDIDIEFRYPYPNYNILEGNIYINDLKYLFDKCKEYENIFDEKINEYLYKENHEAEEIYYGFNIPQYYKLNLKDLLEEYDINKFYVYKKKILINNDGCEVLLLDDNISMVDEIIIKYVDSEFKIGIEKKFGKLYDMDNEKTRNMYYELASMIRFSNAIFVKVNKYLRTKYPYELGIEKHPNNEELNHIYEKLTIGKYFNMLKTITDAIATSGAFMYDE